jgi:hypothetical protein
MKNYRSDEATEKIITAGILLVLILLAIYTASNVGAALELESNVHSYIVAVQGLK